MSANEDTAQALRSLLLAILGEYLSPSGVDLPALSGDCGALAAQT